MTRVKICGNTNYEDARLAIDLGADYLGFIFVPNTKRVLTVEKAEEILSRIKGFKNTVGVFCNQPKQEVETIARRLGFQYLQFHGESYPVTSPVTEFREWRFLQVLLVTGSQLAVGWRWLAKAMGGQAGYLCF